MLSTTHSYVNKILFFSKRTIMKGVKSLKKKNNTFHIDLCHYALKFRHHYQQHHVFHCLHHQVCKPIDYFHPSTAIPFLLAALSRFQGVFLILHCHSVPKR